MSEEKTEGSCCTSKGCGCGCGCGKGVKLIVGILILGFVFAAGMWFAKAHCHMGGASFCPLSEPVAK